MQFLEKVLERPYYGYAVDGELYVPSRREIWKQFFLKFNILRTKKNWLTFSSWILSFLLLIPLVLFFTFHFSWPLLLLAFIYSNVLMGSHGTMYLHRYCSHRAFQFKNPLIRFLAKNLVIKVIPEEIYAVSHLVHHKYSEQPGDPYNVNGGWLYCFLADATHNPISTTLNEKEYNQLAKFVNGSGLKTNSYETYQQVGSLTPVKQFFIDYGLNWAFWYLCFYLIGGHALATCLFGAAGFWAFGVRTFNFDGHGGGKDKRRDGVDFFRGDKSINQLWPGFVAGEWHNNHHLYPGGARSGFLPYQIDLPWIFIYSLHRLGLVTKYRDDKKKFLLNYVNSSKLEEKAIS